MSASPCGYFPLVELLDAIQVGLTPGVASADVAEPWTT